MNDDNGAQSLSLRKKKRDCVSTYSTGDGSPGISVAVTSDLHSISGGARLWCGAVHGPENKQSTGRHELGYGEDPIRL